MNTSPPFDVDMAYSYLGKSLKVNMGGFARSFILSNFREFRERFQVLFRNKKDPFDTFDELLGVCKKYAIKTKFFFQVGNRSKLDKNISHRYGPFREIIKKVASVSEVGIHLSYMSHISEAVMEEEIRRLQFITGKKIVANRFHYLRFTLPASYISLEQNRHYGRLLVWLRHPDWFQGGNLYSVLFFQPV